MLTIPDSRYTFQDLGICVIVCDGLSNEVTGVTYRQMVQLLDQASDGERDVLFGRWQIEARRS